MLKDDVVQVAHAAAQVAVPAGDVSPAVPAGDESPAAAAGDESPAAPAGDESLAAHGCSSGSKAPFVLLRLETGNAGRRSGAGVVSSAGEAEVDLPSLIAPVRIPPSLGVGERGRAVSAGPCGLCR